MESKGYDDEEGSFLSNIESDTSNNEVSVLTKEKLMDLSESELNNSMEQEVNNSHTSLNSDEEFMENSEWQVGQLAWARMSTYPFWPCTVSNEPRSQTHKKLQNSGRQKVLMIHVHFFNDNGQHSWILAHQMFPFYGLEHFRLKADSLTDEDKKKEPKFAAAFTVKPNIFRKWHIAVAEAMDVLYELDLSALEKFKPKLQDITNNSPKNNKSSKKRKRIEVASKSISKYFRAGSSSSNIKIKSNDDSGESSNLNIETPPVSPQPGEDEKKSGNQKPSKKRINLQGPDFNVYFERNLDTVKGQHPDVTDEEIRSYLLTIWDEMSPDEKLKYRGTYKVNQQKS